jgi:hypothetical protein
MARPLIEPEAKVCPICGSTFLVGGRGRPKRSATYCSIKCLNAYRNQVNPKLGSHAPRPKKNRDTLHDPAWLTQRYIVDGLSTPQIGALLGCSAASVASALRKHGIPQRSVREARMHRAPPPATKAAMVAAYGGRCACCGEAELAFLSLDHTKGGGNKHRKAIGGNAKLLRYLRDAGWPTDGYRVLCMNCQFGTRFGRTCPHQPEALPAS